MNGHATVSVSPRIAVLRCGIAVAASICVSTAIAATVVTVLTADGEVQRVNGVSKPRPTRLDVGENGQGILVDEFAVVITGPAGAGVAFASESFATGRDELRKIAAYAAPLPTRTASSRAEVSTGGGLVKRRVPTKPALVVQHQAIHAANDNYTPTPEARFVPQVVESKASEGSRGFAVITMGQSGRVLHVKTLTSEGEVSDPALAAAIANGAETNFWDARRHDHTVYLAYQVRDGEVRQLGRSLVTLPMCCRPEPCNPRCR